MKKNHCNKNRSALLIVILTMILFGLSHTQFVYAEDDSMPQTQEITSIHINQGPDLMRVVEELRSEIASKKAEIKEAKRTASILLQQLEAKEKAEKAKNQVPDEDEFTNEETRLMVCALTVLSFAVGNVEGVCIDKQGLKILSLDINDKLEAALTVGLYVGIYRGAKNHLKDQYYMSSVGLTLLGGVSAYHLDAKSNSNEIYLIGVNVGGGLQLPVEKDGSHSDGYLH